MTKKTPKETWRVTAPRTKGKQKCRYIQPAFNMRNLKSIHSPEQNSPENFPKQNNLGKNIRFPNNIGIYFPIIFPNKINAENFYPAKSQRGDPSAWIKAVNNYQTACKQLRTVLLGKANVSNVTNKTMRSAGLGPIKGRLPKRTCR